MRMVLDSSVSIVWVALTIIAVPNKLFLKSRG